VIRHRVAAAEGAVSAGSSKHPAEPRAPALLHLACIRFMPPKLRQAKRLFQMDD